MTPRAIFFTSAILIAAMIAVAKKQNLAKKTSDICHSTIEEGVIQNDGHIFAHLKRGEYGHWRKWDNQFWDAAQELIRKNNESQKPGAPEYDLYVAPAEDTHYSNRRNLAAGVLCVRGTTKGCRNRNFWGDPSVAPSFYAEIVIRNTILNLPETVSCSQGS